MKHSDPMQHMVIERVCGPHRMMMLSSNSAQASAKTIMGTGEPSRSAQNVAASVEDGRAAA